MAVITPPLFMTVSGYYTGASLGLPYRDLVSQGVVGTASLVVSQRGAGANMSVDVTSGDIWIAGTSSLQQPTYRCYNDATVNLALNAADATHPRLDVIYATVNDAAFAGVSTNWALAVSTGTAAVSPTVPAIPANSLALAVASVNTNAGSVVNGNITDKRGFASNAMPGFGTFGAYTSATVTPASTPSIVYGLGTFTAPQTGWYKTVCSGNIAVGTGVNNVQSSLYTYMNGTSSTVGGFVTNVSIANGSYGLGVPFSVTGWTRLTAGSLGTVGFLINQGADASGQPQNVNWSCDYIGY